MTYAIGTKFLRRTKYRRLVTITDIHTTKNLAGDIIKLEYVASHEFMGQNLSDTYLSIAVARGIEELESLGGIENFKDLK